MRTAPPDNARALAGTASIAFLIAGSRWGSHLGVGPIYVTDLLLGGAIFHRWVSHRVLGNPSRASASSRGHPGPILILFLLWVVLRAILGLGGLSMVAVRDLAPYAYSLLAILAAASYSASSQGSRQKTVVIIRVALIVHLMWLLVTLYLPFLTDAMPIVDGVRLFSLRRDFDGSMMGVLAALSIWRILTRCDTRTDWLALVGTVVALAGVQSRAALVGALAAIGLAVWAAMSKGSTRGRRQTFINATAVLFALTALLGLVPNTSAGTRLIATINPATASSAEQIGALGTATARARAWGKLKSWVEEEPRRQVIGVGFGPDFLHDSGADLLLLNREIDEVRSPHNYLLGTYARLGLVGLILWSILALQLLRIVRRQFALFPSDQLVLLSSLIIVSLIPTGLLGVVFEAPFGAIPFFWGAGILLSLPAPQEERERWLATMPSDS